MPISTPERVARAFVKSAARTTKASREVLATMRAVLDQRTSLQIGWDRNPEERKDRRSDVERMSCPQDREPLDPAPDEPEARLAGVIATSVGIRTGTRTTPTRSETHRSSAPRSVRNLTIKSGTSV
jgi:hypothetical protein